MAKEKTTHAWGGRREGAGRPRTGSKIYTFRVPEAVARIIDGQPSKTEFIRNCINAHIGQPPGLTRLGETQAVAGMADIRLPFFDIGIVAGFPVPLDNDERSQDIGLLQMLCPHPEASYLIRVDGESMVGAGIHSGDIVIVDKSNREPSENEVAVCELNGEYTLKHFVRKDGRGWLVPANPDYPKIEITEGDDFSIWGTVTYVIHKPRR